MPAKRPCGAREMAEDYKSPPMAMMPPTIVVAAASAPTVMVAATAVMAPPMTTAVTVATLYENNRTVSVGKRIRVRARHCGRGSRRSKAAECSKSKKRQFEFHGFLL
jgi:hypothetical protein